MNLGENFGPWSDTVLTKGIHEILNPGASE